MDSVRQDTLGQWMANRLFLAFFLSLAIHLAVVGGVQLGRALGLWDMSPLRLLKQMTLMEPLNEAQRQQEGLRETPLVFIQVDPSLVSDTTPEEAEYYGAADTIAANDKADIPSNKPRVDGPQDLVPNTLEAANLATPMIPTPASPPEAAPPRPVPAERIKPAEQPALASTRPEPPIIPPAVSQAAVVPETRPAPVPVPTPAPPRAVPSESVIHVEPVPNESPAPTAPVARPRPRTLAEVQQRSASLTERMQQEGGVERTGSVTLNVKGTVFGSYDAKFVSAVEQSWHQIMKEWKGSSASGKVVLEFRLHFDGRITDMEVIESNVGETQSYICQRAILRPVPFDPWPIEMRRELPSSYRNVRFTFHYR